MSETVTSEKLSDEVVTALHEFWVENNPFAKKGPLESYPDDDTLRAWISFAGREAQKNPGSPRTLKAYQTVWMVPQDFGAKLFAPA